MARLGPKRLVQRAARWLGGLVAIAGIAGILGWAYTGQNPVAHLTASIGSGSVAKLHVITPGSNGLALCLDGTSPAIYVSHNAESQDWIVYLGQDSLYWCLDDEDCLSRSRTMQGSSRGLPGELELHGVLSNSQEVNPDFHSWSKAVIHACDGSGFLGHRAAPFHVADKPLYSRGYHVIFRALDWLRREHQTSMQPHKARLLFVGQGSSGVGLMVAAPAIAKQFPFNRVKFALEGSVMPEKLPSLIDRLKQVAATHHLGSNPGLKACLAEDPQPHSDNVWRCLLLSSLISDQPSDSAFFFSGSNYDRWLAVNSLGLPCAIRDCRDDEQSYGRYEALRESLIDSLAPVDKKSAKDAIWMCSCWSRGHLVHDQLLTRVQVEGFTLSKALSSWYFSEKPVKLHLIDGSHPSNPTCPV